MLVFYLTLELFFFPSHSLSCHLSVWKVTSAFCSLLLERAQGGSGALMFTLVDKKLSFLIPEILPAGASSSHGEIIAGPSRLHQCCPYPRLLGRNEKYNISCLPITVLPHVRGVSHGSISQHILSA